MNLLRGDNTRITFSNWHIIQRNVTVAYKWHINIINCAIVLLIDPCFTSFTCSDTNNNNYNFVTIFYFQNYICTVMLQIYNPLSLWLQKK